MRFLASIVLLLAFSINASGQKILKDLPDSLKEGANEIILYDHTVFSIQDLSRSSYSRKYQAIIMNKNADNLTSIFLHYNDFREIKDARIWIYDLSLDKKEQIKLKDFGDYSTKGYSIASDSRAKYYKVTRDRYPYVIEVEYSINYSGSMFYPAWHPQSDENQGVILSTLTIECPSNVTFRHKSVKSSPVTRSKDQSNTTFFWKVENLKSFEFEPFSYSLEEYAPIVYTAPNDFEMDGYVGNLSTWNNFGLWINKLNSGKNTLNQSDLQAVKNSVPQNGSMREKVEAVYKYLQENTRYVSIQLGIGGWQPFESGFVHENKYGDCKALSFYTQSLLSAFDIPSYYTLINAGRNTHKTDPNFPEAHFNHAILTVPLENDTVWLECTSQTNPFGYLGMFTSNRNALMITETGGKIVRTRNYTAKENTQSTTTKLVIEKDGLATGEVTRIYKGIEIENNGFSGAVLKPESEQLKWFYDRHNWGSLKISSLDLELPTNQIVPHGKLFTEFKLENAAISNSDRLFYKPFVFTNIDFLELPKRKRKKPLEIRYPFTQSDTIHVTFPEVYFPESVPDDVLIESQYGTYQRTISKDQNKFLIIRKFVLGQGKYAPTEYDSIRTFIRKVQKQDRAKIVMLNKT